MPSKTIRIPPGVMRGESRAMIPGRYYDTNLIRWQQGLLKPMGGWERLNASPLLSVPRAAHVWLDENGERHMVVLCDDAVWREQDNTYTEITPTDYLNASGAPADTTARGYGSGNFGQKDYGMDDEMRDVGATIAANFSKQYVKHSADNWNTELLFSSSQDGRIFSWDPATPGTAPVVVPDAPTFVQAFLCTDEHSLMAFGSDGFPNRVAWSNQGNREEWDYTDITGQAGFFDLEGAGYIITAHKVPGAILIFTTTSVWLCRYIGQPYYYGFQKIADGAAPISAHAIAVAGSRIFWMGRNSFWKYEGGVVDTLPCSLGFSPFEEMDPSAMTRRVTAGYNGSYPEVMWFYPSKRNIAPNLIENDRYVVFCMDRGQEWWANGYVGRSMFTSSPIDGYPLAGDEQTYIYRHETGYLAEGAPRGDMVYAEIGTISLDDGSTNWQINQFMVDSPLGPESIKFQFRGNRSRGGPEISFGSYIPRTDGYVDTAFTARDFIPRIIGRLDGPWAVGALVFNNIQRRGVV